uniref:ATPase family AAA domain-containing protein 5b isoform X2 n=1 Tax=Scatophagus argus TaxID=75038 RepID=UPI001ED7EF89|nr:ATPase family AAA domain-containing protein 5b isoform X2 [Scatophagus argus]
MTDKRQSQNATGKPLNSKFFMMLNKLKRDKKCKDVSCPSKQQPRSADGIKVELSESSCSDDQTDAASLAAKVTYGSDVAAAGIPARKVRPQKERMKTFCAKDIKIAPIFLQTAQHKHKSKRISDGKLDQPAERVQKPVLPPLCEDVQQLKSQQQVPTVFHLLERKGSWRGQLSPSTLCSCLESIQTSNPAFPVRAVFSTLQRKASLQDAENFLNLNSPQKHLKEKRKRENESSDREPKRLKSAVITEGAVGMGHCHTSAQGVQDPGIVVMASRQPRISKLSRTRRLREQSSSSAVLVYDCDLMSGTRDSSQSLKTSDVLQRDSSFEDVLWTDKYSPQHSSEVIGNSACVNKLQSWLKKWKLRAICDERRRVEERKREENSNDSWDCGDFQGEAGVEDAKEEPLCNTMLITGPPGVGKTASVYACSQELGFKVFEVNCSSQRSGCHVLSQLKEATQSHLVEMSGKDALKPAYFNNYSSVSKSGKTVPLKNVPSTSKKRAAQNFGRSSHRGKTNPATVTLAKYFKMKAKADHLHLGEKPDSKTLGSQSPGPDQTEPQDKKTATSLILFEEVDVIFDDDVGFLAAIKTFMTTTKRPVVLTTNDTTFRKRFNCSLEEIIFKTPSAVNVCSYLQLVALAENARLELDDVSSLLRLSGGDVRRCLLQLQLWVQSGGGRASESGGLHQELTCVQDLSVTERGDNADSRLPQCDTGCTVNMLGLYSVTKNQLLNLLKCQSWSEVDIKLLRLLAESWRGGVPLLYSNLELLLPIAAKGTSVHFQTACDLHIQHLDGYVTLKATATDCKSVRNISRLSRRKSVTTMFETTSSSSLAQTPKKTSSSSNRAHSRALSWRHKTQQNTAKVATDCLDALADFFDLMSYLDATMLAVSGSCRPEAFVWTGAEVKDGLLDEMREDHKASSLSQETLLDIQAAVEGLGCRRCLLRVSDVWTAAQKYRQELGDTKWRKLVEGLKLPPASSQRQSLSFSFPPPCAPRVSQRRYELSRTVLGSNSFGLLGNRKAVSVDYMPVLRYICRFQRAQRKKEEPLRCLNYLSSLNLGLSKSTIQLLAEDFL